MIKLTRYATDQLIYTAASDARRLVAAEDGEGTHVTFGDGQVEDAQEIAHLIDEEVARVR